jgi:hypothetical protein
VIFVEIVVRQAIWIETRIRRDLDDVPLRIGFRQIPAAQITREVDHSRHILP